MVSGQYCLAIWLGDHQGRPSAPLSPYVKVSKYGALTNILQLQLGVEYNKEQYFSFDYYINIMVCDDAHRQSL